MNSATDLEAKFRATFGMPAALYRAPGRVNLIGEHTDYNDGFVMPAAIDFECQVAVAPREDRALSIYSVRFDEKVQCDLDNLPQRAAGTWSDYAIGVAVVLEQGGYRLKGANILVSGDVPIGAGLSSSAAIEVSIAYALLERAGYDIDRVQLAKLCQRAENEFVGARCGIMDQFIACNGRAGHVLMLDCRSLHYQLLPLPEQVSLVICNTMIRHEHASGEYNIRRSECEEGVRMLAKALPEILALRDVNRKELERHCDRLPPAIYKRCRHVVTENERVLKAAAALQHGDIASFGRLMTESHRSLRLDYEVSCAELDLLVEIAQRQKGVYGARMTGGGFGGCTINLVTAANAAAFRRCVAESYEAATGRRPEIYVCKASPGVTTRPAAMQVRR